MAKAKKAKPKKAKAKKGKTKKVVAKKAKKAKKVKKVKKAKEALAKKLAASPVGDIDPIPGPDPFGFHVGARAKKPIPKRASDDIDPIPPNKDNDPFKI